MLILPISLCFRLVKLNLSASNHPGRVGMIDTELYEDALDKLERDILAKTDGCAERGEVDKNDWIVTCEAQGEVYGLVMETIEYVRSLLE